MSLSSDTMQPLLDVLRRSSADWRTPESIAAELGWDLDLTTDLLADLDVGGWIEVQERSDDVAVGLSQAAHEILAADLSVRHRTQESARAEWSLEYAAAY